MPSPFRTPAAKAADKEQKLADMAAHLVAESEVLTDDQKGQVIASSSEDKKPDASNVSLKDALNGVLGNAKNTKSPVQASNSDEIDLEDLDETTLLKYPIAAKYLNDSAMVRIKPLNSALAFRWVYFNNGMIKDNQDKVSANNVGRYKHWGFEFASIEDIEGGGDALVEGIIDDGGKIINYDTVLMKIDKIRLMGHYKKNLLKSISDMDSSLGKAAKTAEGDLVQSGAYRKAMASHPQAKIEFFSTV